MLMDRTWLIDSRGLAKKVINASVRDEHQIKDCGATRQCPNCFQLVDNSDVSEEWPGLPAGVKFDPSDVELLHHLAAKRGDDCLKSHVFIDEFIPTLESDEGICYTHPENLPGAKKDGSSVHFFYRIINAYASGRRKRRRIQDQENTINSHIRWHKTGKTKPVVENGVQKGFKKIMVLYGTMKKGSKPEKCNWVMHQYHLGMDEDEKEGDLVVSKIFYQPQKNDHSLVVEESDIRTVKIDPRTPMSNPPDPPRSDKTPSSDCLSDDWFMQSLIMETDYLKEPSHASFGSRLEDEVDYVTCLGKRCESNRGNTLICGETITSSSGLDELRPKIFTSLAQVDSDAYGIGDLDNLELDSPPDFQLNDLTFASQDSVFDFLDRL